MDGFVDISRVGRRQDAEKYYRINGAIYIQNRELLMKNQSIYGERSYAYIMDKTHSVDIDDEVDFKIAELLVKK